jgi:hypothetical protein
VDSELGYFLIIVFGLPILLLLLTGPGMWSEKWGWGALDRVESWFRRRSGRRSGQPARDLLDRTIDPDPRRVDRAGGVGQVSGRAAVALESVTGLYGVRPNIDLAHVALVENR